MNRIKGLGNGGGRYGWWELTPYSGNSSHFCIVNNYGNAATSLASGTWLSAPVCFRIRKS